MVYATCDGSGWVALTGCAIDYVPAFMPVTLFVFFIIMMGWLMSKGYNARASLPSVLSALFVITIMLRGTALVTDRELYVVGVAFFASTLWAVFAGNKGVN